MRRLALMAAALALVSGCAQRVHRTMVGPDALATVDAGAPYLKAHLRDGSLVVLSRWTANDSTRAVAGAGTRYTVDRTPLPDSVHSIPLDSVAIFETNVTRQSPTVGSLAVVTGLSAAVTLFCATNPKTCFGSCPTFYVSDGVRDVLQAEGFSASIAPSLEARDIDALYRARFTGRSVRVDMLNEAYETHVVRYARLLAAPRREGERVFHDGSGQFWRGTTPVPVSSCDAAEGDCHPLLAVFDERERTSVADSTDLAARETVDLTFPPTASPGLVIASRQSLLPTYLLYQGLAYLGTNVSSFMRALSRADSATIARTRSMADLLGGITVQVQGDSGWQTLSTIRETGPLASDLRVVPLPDAGKGADSIRVRLVMARGAWRVDWTAVTSLVERVTPIALEPAGVRTAAGEDAGARAKLQGGSDALVTWPGDRYTLFYELPGDARDYELFLDTRGYYLEWMREEWLSETSAARAAALFLDPAGSLRRLAPSYKRVEAQMDSAFWRSKYVSH